MSCVHCMQHWWLDWSKHISTTKLLQDIHTCYSFLCWMFVLASATIPTPSQLSMGPTQPLNPINCQWLACLLAMAGSSKQVVLATHWQACQSFVQSMFTPLLATFHHPHSLSLTLTSPLLSLLFYNHQDTALKNKAIHTAERKQVTSSWLPARKLWA